jgi:hypothetical protein
MYKAAQPQGATSGSAASGATKPPTGTDGTAKDEGVVDAEYVDVDDRKSA